MDYEKLVADLKDWLPPESKKIPYGELVGAVCGISVTAHALIVLVPGAGGAFLSFPVGTGVISMC